MSDQIIKFGKSIIQHGKENNRVYLMKLSTNDMPHIMCHIDSLSTEYGYTKVIAKIGSDMKDTFINNGYFQEAFVPKFYDNDQDCCFMGKFYTQQRKKEAHLSTAEEVLDKSFGKKAVYPTLKPEFSLRKATRNDTDEMVNLYKKVFATYPFPIHKKEYLMETLENNVVYFGVWHKGSLVALSSCELDCAQSNAEMTDFATLPEYRGQNLSLNLLERMEEELRQRNINMAYTIARAYSFGMNITFAKANYAFAGRLINNTNISGNIESMNVWYKQMK